MSKKSSLLITDSLQSLYSGHSKTAEKLENAGIRNILELLWFLPKRIQTIPPEAPYAHAIIDLPFQGRGKVLSIIKKPCWNKGKKGRFGNISNLILDVEDHFSDKTIKLKWFNVYPNIINKYQKGSLISFNGTVSEYNGILQIISPEAEQVLEECQASKSHFLHVQYGTLASIGPKQIKKLIAKIPISLFNNITDNLPQDLLEKYRFQSLGQSFLILHGLIHSTEEVREKSYQRLIYEEFFQEQAQIFYRKNKIKNLIGISISSTKKEIQTFLKAFPYELTDDQKKCIIQIKNDLETTNPMMRLIQGDVGSGKTCVAIISTLIASSRSHQVAIMCPTEALALQHYTEFAKYIIPMNKNISLLTSSTPTSEKKIIIDDLSSGDLPIVIGTHSLISDKVKFKNLGLIIIDEQHKFGVNQRLDLVKKTFGANCLIMTATPIPRSLRLTQFGDLDVSSITTMPKNRKGYKTKIIKPNNLQNFFNFIKTRLSMKEQIYIVVPAISDNNIRNIQSLENTHKRFTEIFSESSVEFLHGKMKPEEKKSIFTLFKNHKIDILIATSVIEVGIDNPNATVMAIFNPECFGLSSLHQLRGRVGRGNKPGFCFLLIDENLSNSSYERLKILERHNDGLKIAELDLQNRGEGDLFGVFQSGKDNSKHLANMTEHLSWLENARADFKNIYNKNPDYIKKFNNLMPHNILTTI